MSKTRRKLTAAFFAVAAFPAVTVCIASYIFITTKPSNLPHNVRVGLNTAFVILMITTIVTSFIAFLWIYFRLVKPVDTLRSAIKEIKEGHLDKPVDVQEKSDISGLCRDLEEMRRQLMLNTEDRLQYEKDMRAMMSNMAHDLRTPLTAIKGYAEGIIDGVADSPAKKDKYLRTIYSKANDLSYLVDELSQFARVEQEQDTYNFKTVNLNDFFQDCVEELSLDMESKGFTIRYRNNVPNTVHILADPEQLKRVINNITGNSVKYCDTRPGVITISISELVKGNDLYKKVARKGENSDDSGQNDTPGSDNTNKVLVSIKDNGKGVAAEDLDNIFKRFYRADASRNSSKPGSGLGLAIVARIIKEHGGQIWAASNPGEGLDICFTLVEK